MKQNLFVFCVLMFLCSNIYSQETLVLGKVIDSVPVISTTDETFAIYLPSSFNKNELSPIVFIFDPAARGAVGLSSFIDSSEKYGYILVCSNNSKNGPYERSFNLANNLFNHIFKKFNIDQSNMYLAGFSGGSRLVSTIAVLTNNFSGVIACGAGFASHPLYIPSSSTQKFSYVALCGNEDFNYKEMIANSKYLRRIGFNNTLITYNDKHKWPSKNQINRAFRWLQNKKTNDSLIISENLKIDLNESEKFISSGEFLFAAENYDRILKSYSSFPSLDSVKNKYENLIRSQKYKVEYRSLQNALKEEVKIFDKLFAKLQKDFSSPEKANLVWWKKELGKLEKLKTRGSAQQQKMIARIRFSLFASLYSRKNKNLYQSSSKQIDLSNKIQNLIYLK